MLAFVTIGVAALLALAGGLFGAGKLFEGRAQRGISRDTLAAQEAQFERAGELASEARTETRAGQGMLIEALTKKTKRRKRTQKIEALEAIALQQSLNPASADILSQGVLAASQPGAISQGAIQRAAQRLGL